MGLQDTISKKMHQAKQQKIAAMNVDDFAKHLEKIDKKVNKQITVKSGDYKYTRFYYLVMIII